MRDVLAARPQRRNCQRQHVQAIEQVFAEMSALTRSSNLRLVAENDPDVDFHGFAPADRFDRAFLQCAQQFHLRCERQFRDLVEEQRAAGGFDEFTGVAFGGAGKGALLMAEQDRLHQIIGIAPQLTATNGFDLRSPLPWMARANNSLRRRTRPRSAPGW